MIPVRTPNLCIALLAGLLIFNAGTVARAADQDMDALAVETLSQWQPLSLAENKEYCGYIFVGRDSTFQVTTPSSGDLSGCTPNFPEDENAIVASLHTHGAFTVDFDSEIPSSDDVLADADEGINGYVSTPGGRIWYIDGQAQVVEQMCGAGCIPADQRYSEDDGEAVEQTYTLNELYDREGAHDDQGAR